MLKMNERFKTFALVFIVAIAVIVTWSLADSLKRNKGLFNREVDRLKSELSEAIQRNQQLAVTVEDSDRTIQQLTFQLGETRRTIDDLTNTVVEFEATVGRQRRIISELTNANTEASNAVDRIRGLTENSEDIIDELINYVQTEVD